ncbi:ubiquinol-cytochrome c reductase-like protein [Leptotrombidium deliense]|uniref:Cytochrome b-c1 complex subunit 8 n=1 Tax=Leptotrombidium deliense TaxID=299467 RepID=A0A443SFY1_9ACAR|nr:ubiquinol-cytochrome c reductase-like protein [Leptotrombidium deliense]
MGKFFGNLYHIRNIIYIRLSPYEQKAFANYWPNTIRGFKRDFNANAAYFIPPLLLFVMIRHWANAEFEKSLRKKPEDYENDRNDEIKCKLVLKNFSKRK